MGRTSFLLPLYGEGSGKVVLGKLTLWGKCVILPLAVLQSSVTGVLGVPSPIMGTAFSL